MVDEVVGSVLARDGHIRPQTLGINGTTLRLKGATTRYFS